LKDNIRAQGDYDQDNSGRLAGTITARPAVDRGRVAELIERGRRLDEAASEDSLSGHLHRAIHRSGRPLRKIAAEVGLDVLMTWLLARPSGSIDKRVRAPSPDGVLKLILPAAPSIQLLLTVHSVC
jgi:hypothetical protein